MTRLQSLHEGVLTKQNIRPNELRMLWRRVKVAVTSNSGDFFKNILLQKNKFTDYKLTKQFLGVTRLQTYWRPKEQLTSKSMS